MNKLKRLSDPITRTLWRVALFKAHRYSTIKLWFHCLFNIHQFGTIFNTTHQKKVFMTQHFCATCYPDILPKIVEALKKQQKQQKV